MSPEEFRLAGHQLVDWIADYRKEIERYPVRAQVDPGDIKNSIPGSPPDQPITAAEVLSMVEEMILPGITHVQHPMHFGWFPSNASLASVLGDFASSGLGSLGISWESCPSLTEVEELVCDWMRQLTGLSTGWHGCIQDTASTSCLTALLAARERTTGISQNHGGLQSELTPLTVYTTDEAHSSVQKSTLLAGFGYDNLNIIPNNPQNRSMSATALARIIKQDIAKGCKPSAIIASSGSTGVTAFDPLDEIAEIAGEHNIWLHVDAAMAGSVLLLPEYRQLMNGVEKADSLCWNPHKWMGTVLDCSLFYVRDLEHLNKVMSTNPSYLRSSADTEVIQLRDRGIPLGRRFRALKLWYHLLIDGADTIRKRLRRDLKNAQWLAQEVQGTPGWHVLAPVTLQTVCIRHEPNGMQGEALDKHTLTWVNAINVSGRAFISPAKLDGHWMVRISIGVESTTCSHVKALWHLVRQEAERALA